jgi:hypothetical protein
LSPAFINAPASLEYDTDSRMQGGRLRGPKGNKHALKQGRYSGETIACRREVAALIRNARARATEEAS